MRYDLYQIKGDTSPKADECKVAMMMDFRGKKIGGIAEHAMGMGYYTRVATLNVSSLDEAFQVGNIGPEEQITRHDRMASVSVGDVLVNEEGWMFVVANFGFEAVGIDKTVAA